MTALAEITVKNCQRLSPTAVERFVPLANLEAVTLDDWLVSDESLTHLARLKRLRWLTIECGADVTAEGLAQLRPCRACASSIYSSSRTTWCCWLLEGLCELNQVEEIYIEAPYNPFDDAALEKLAKVEGVRELVIGIDGQVTSAGLATPLLYCPTSKA